MAHSLFNYDGPCKNIHGHSYKLDVTVIGEPISDDRLPGFKWAGSELNFGLRDISESDQIGLSSFHAAVYTNSDPNVPRNDPLMWQWLSADTIGDS